MSQVFEPILTTVLIASAVKVSKIKHCPYKREVAAQLWGLGLEEHRIPVAHTWGFREVPEEVWSTLATRVSRREQSGQVIEYQGRQYFALFHHSAEHCAIIADCLKRNEPYLSLVHVNHLLLPDRRG